MNADEVFKEWEKNMRLADEEVVQPKNSIFGQGIRKNASLHERGDASTQRLRKMHQRVGGGAI